MDNVAEKMILLSKGGIKIRELPEQIELFSAISVPVTYAQLERDGRIINSSLLDVFYGAAVELTCNVSPSRPAPAIAWYIGSVLKQESTSTTFTFTVSYSDQYKTIFCKAYNLKLQSQAVESSKPMLNVKGNVYKFIIEL